LLPNQKIQIGENFEMKKTILLASLIFIAFDATIPSFAYNEIDLAKFKALNACEGCDLNEAKKDSSYLKIMLKSEIAGAKWGRNELWGVRISTDNQLITALKHFNEADAFLIESN